MLTISLTPFGAATSNDSLDYFAIAEFLAEDKGRVLPWREPEELYERILHPPLYPLTLSLFLTADETPERSAATLALWALFISALLLFELLRPSIGPAAALVGALVCMISLPMLTVFTFAWSESLAVPLLLLSSWCCVRCTSAADDGRSKESAVFLGLLLLSLTALTYTRFIGATFVVLLPLAWLLSRSRGSTVAYILGSLSLAVLLGIFLRDHHVLRRLADGTSTSPVDNIRDAVSAVSLAFSTHPALLVIMGLISSAGVWVSLRSGKLANDNESRLSRICGPMYTSQLGWVCLCIVMTHLAGMVVVRTFLGFHNHLDTRLMAPLFPFLLVLLFLGLFRVWKQASPPIWSRVLAAGCATMILLSATQGASTYTRSIARQFPVGGSGFRQAKTAVYRDLTPPSDPEGACLAFLMRAKFFIILRGNTDEGNAYGRKALRTCVDKRRVRETLREAFARKIRR